MVHFTRKMQLAYLLAEGKTLPEGIQQDKKYPIVGYRTEKKTITSNGTQKEIESITWYIINSAGRLFSVWDSCAILILDE